MTLGLLLSENLDILLAGVLFAANGAGTMGVTGLNGCGTGLKVLAAA